MHNRTQPPQSDFTHNISNSLSGSPNSRLLTQVAFRSSLTTSGNGVGTTTPVYHPPPSFADVRFGIIGKQPNLLSRISAPDPTKVTSRSPSPFASPPSPVAPNGHIPGSRRLVERIQMSPAQEGQSMPTSGVLQDSLTTLRTNHRRYAASSSPVPSSNLIPPIEILSTASESTLPSSYTQSLLFQQVQAIENRVSPDVVRETSMMPDPMYPVTVPNVKQPNLNAPQSNPPILDTSAAPLPQPTWNSVSSKTTAPSSPKLPGLSGSEVPDVTAAEGLQKSVAQDNLSTIHARLREKCNTFASLALPALLSRSPSPLGVPSNMSELTAGLHNEVHTEGHDAIVLHHPYPQYNSTSNGNSYRELLSSDSNALTPASSQTPGLLASRHTHLSSLVEAMKKLQTAAGDAVRAQLDADQAFASERMEFDQRQKMFEEHMLAREAEYQSRKQAMQERLEELQAKEKRLVVLEEESQLREETRRARDAQRRAQDRQRKLEDESKLKAIHEEMADAMQLLEEAKVEKQRWQEERERSEKERAAAQVIVPPLQVLVDIGPRVEKEDGMTEEEINAINEYDQCSARILHLSEELQSLIACTHRLSGAVQRMKEARLQAAEAERQRIAAEAESQRVQAEATRQRVQLEVALRRNEEQECQGRGHLLDTQRPHQSISIGEGDLSQIGSSQQAHPKPQRLQGPRNAEAGHPRPHAQVAANQQQITITSENTTRIHAERAGIMPLSVSRDTNSPVDADMSIEIDELEPSPVEYTMPLPGQKDVSRRKFALKTTKTGHSRGISGKAMLGTLSTTPSRLPDSHTPPTPSTVIRSDAPAWDKTPSFVLASTEVGRQVITDTPLYPTEFASELDLPTSPLSNGSVSMFKNIPIPTTPKSQTILSSQIRGIAFNPLANPSPAHQDANLRHIKKNRYRFQSNSVDPHVKQPDDDLPIKTIKIEREADTLHDSGQTSDAAPEGLSTLSTDSKDPAQHDDLLLSQVIVNTSESKQSGDPQIFAKPISQLPDVSSRGDSQGDLLQPMPRLPATPISPDPLIRETSVERRGWTAVPVLPYTEPSESTYHCDSEHGSRQNRQSNVPPPLSGSFTRRQHRSDDPDHYSHPPVHPLPSRPHPLERNDPGASRPAVRPRINRANYRPVKRPAESDIEDDSRDWRRRRGDHYEPEQDKDYRQMQELVNHHHSTGEQRGARSISPSDHPYSYGQRPLEHRIRDSSTVPQSIWSEDNCGADYTNVADDLSDTGYSIEDRPTPDEPQGSIALLERLSSFQTPARRANPARGKGRGKGESGRRRGSRGRAQPSLPLQDRIEKRIG